MSYGMVVRVPNAHTWHMAAKVHSARFLLGIVCIHRLHATL